MITKGSLYMMIVNSAPEKRNHIIGRALVALFKRQTEAERVVNTTDTNNNRGFTSADAKWGSIAAKYYIKHGKLEDWQVEPWLVKDARGTMRIQKYWKQLDEVAKEKAMNQQRLAA
jgi:hypothetical protein